MKVLGVIGSPRKGGHTATLVEKVLEGARAVGSETESLYLGQLNIGPCLGCEKCTKTGQCVQDDDMQAVYKTIQDCRALVFGSPVYFDHVTAQAKAFIDRLYRNWDTKLERVSFPAGSKGIIAITYENPNQDRYELLIEWLKYWLECRLGVETVGILKAESTRKQPVSARPELLESAYDWGKILGERVRML